MLIIQFHTLSLWKNASHTNFILFCKLSLIEFQRYFIVVLVSKLVSLHKKRKKNGMKKMLTKQFPYMEIVWLAFKKKLWKKALYNQFNSGKTFKRFLGCYNWKLWLFYFFFLKKNTSHTISNYGNCMTSIFLMATTKIFKVFLKLPPKIFLCFFFSIANWFSYSSKHFLERKILHAKFIFFVYNVVLDILILDFFFFSRLTFFQKRLKLLFLLYDMFLYALINVW